MSPTLPVLLALFALTVGAAPAVEAAAMPEPGELLPPHTQCHLSILGICPPDHLPVDCDILFVC